MTHLHCSQSLATIAYNNNSSFFTHFELPMYCFSAATLCQVYPSNYSFFTNDIENYNMTIDRSRCRCTSNPAYTTCQHPCTLTDSITGDGTVNSTDYFLWRSNATNSRILLFTFPQIVLLHTITLYYYIDRSSNVDPVLQFFAAEDNFDLLFITENNILIES